MPQLFDREPSKPEHGRSRLREFSGLSGTSDVLSLRERKQALSSDHYICRSTGTVYAGVYVDLHISISVKEGTSVPGGRKLLRPLHVKVVCWRAHLLHRVTWLSSKSQPASQPSIPMAR